MPELNTYTYDICTDVGKVRLLIGDHPSVNDVSYSYMYSDEEVQAFLSMSNNSAHKAAAMMLEMIAVDSSKTAKSVSILDISVSDGDYSGALKARAKSLFEQGDDIEESEIFVAIIPGAISCGC